jgi:hypothetical protein
VVLAHSRDGSKPAAAAVHDEPLVPPWVARNVPGAQSLHTLDPDDAHFPQGHA